MDVKPLRLIPEDRGEDRKQHSRFQARVEPLDVSEPSTVSEGALPVASLPLHPGEHYAIQRGKTRPVVVLGAGGPEVPARTRGGGARWQTSGRLTVAPYFGTDQGWNADFVRRIRHCEWPQYLWDRLPSTRDGAESVLRLDMLFPLGKEDARSYRVLPYKLSEDALAVMDEWLEWHLRGTMRGGGPLSYIRSQLLGGHAAHGIT